MKGRKGLGAGRAQACVWVRERQRHVSDNIEELNGMQNNDAWRGMVMRWVFSYQEGHRSFITRSLTKYV